MDTVGGIVTMLLLIATATAVTSQDVQITKHNALLKGSVGTFPCGIHFTLSRDDLKETRRDIKKNLRDGQSHLIDKRIVGGVKSADGVWPWQVALLLNFNQVCAGSLIDSRWIITAGHCFKDPHSSTNPADWTVLLGERIRRTRKRHFERIRKVKSIRIHPKFRGKLVNGVFAKPIDYDIALVELERPVVFDSHVYPICLPQAHYNQTPGKVCYITGWGRNGWKGSRAKYLRQAAVPLVSRDVCNRKESYNGEVHSTSLCAGYDDGRVDACQSDSGGPLACREDGRWYLTGVISWGKKCARPHKYGVYANVKVLGPWIEKEMSAVN